MTVSRADLLAVVEQSPAATSAHDRDAWVGLFTPTARVEDPVGSRPHVGPAAIARFYDTFIGPRDITFDRDVDVVVGTTVVRDLQLAVGMGGALTLRIPAYLRYDLQEHGGELKIAALQAFWELPAMVGQFVRSGVAAVPAGLALGRALLRNQGADGTAGFLRGLRGHRRATKDTFTQFLTAAGDGDELGMRRRLAAGARLTLGDSAPAGAGDLADRLTGARWHKPIGCGPDVVAGIDAGGRRGVVFGRVGPGPVLTEVRLFAEW